MQTSSNLRFGRALSQPIPPRQEIETLLNSFPSTRGITQEVRQQTPRERHREANRRYAESVREDARLNPDKYRSITPYRMREATDAEMRQHETANEQTHRTSSNFDKLV